MDLPSFTGFPWRDVLLVGLFCLTVAAAAGAAEWVRYETRLHAIGGSPRWNLLVRGIGLAILIGCLTLGLPSLAVGWGLLATSLVLFTRERDKAVPAAHRYLSAQGVAAILADLRRARRPRGQAAAKTSLKWQFQKMLQGLRATAGRGKGRTASRAGPKAEPESAPDEFAFLKKDGTVAIRMAAEGEPEEGGAAISDNVSHARDVILNAMRSDATDLHLDPHEHEYFVRVRIDGVLRDVGKMESEDAKGVVSAIKVIADMDIAERRRPQDGAFAIVHGRDKYDIRVASTPTSYGEKLVMRLLRSSGGVMTGGLGSIGLRPPLLKQLREIIHKPYGMFLVVGPTGSGKTTTVYASLSEIDAHQHNITTIEDPVEYRLDNITQIAVNTKAGVSFASILRSVLRQDPDVLLVGEIRDRETAEIACQSALTGHFVFSTLHANDSVASITRLLDLGLEPTLIQTAVTAVLGQRLARRLCPDCKEACEPPSGMLKKFNLKPGAIPHVFREKGCDKCGGTGYRGRTGIHELLVMNDAIRGLITTHPSINDLKKAAVQSGTHTLQIDGLFKVIQGETSVNEILRVTT